ncbi:MAG: hypothetical protein ABW321_15390 [Polyangiales bacterium]
MTRRFRMVLMLLAASGSVVSIVNVVSIVAPARAQAQPPAADYSRPRPGQPTRARDAVRPLGREGRLNDAEPALWADERRGRRGGAHRGDVPAAPAGASAEPRSADTEPRMPGRVSGAAGAAASGGQALEPVVSAPGTDAAASSGEGRLGGVQPLAAESGERPAGAAPAEQLAGLRSDVAQLIDDMVQARARAAELGKTLFKTRLRLKIQNLAAPDPVLVKIVLTLDGAPIFRGDGAVLREDDARQVFDGMIAPGPHVLLAELEQRSRGDAAYGYTLHDTYRFQALRNKRSELTLIIDDDSDLAHDFPDDAKGEYDVRIKLRVRTKDLDEE